MSGGWIFWGIIASVFGAFLLMLLSWIDWPRIFGAPPRADRMAAARYAEARDKVSSILSGAISQMERRTGSGDPFRLGGRR